ncbi:hypothetical protein [Lutibacter flavus]|uniref:SpoIIAA-like n=1 Tax=Lutibacter flavus TaxID=691689 RepID=A0A238X0V0_9FLAO|nr:hypothetical protein [Lutibacter flavus]SNR52290.1 hypothetical protein SAMN04488111_1426 [Lutibacter flavus]
MVKEKFNKTTNILETAYIGNVNLSEVVNYIIATKNNKQYPRILKIISDTRDAEFNFSIEDLSVIVEENYKSLENYNGIIDAIIINNPKNTVLSVLYKEIAKTKKYKFEIFASKNAALTWLNKQKI